MTNQNNGKYLPRGRKRRKNSPVSRLLLVVALVSALIFGVTVFIALRNQIALKRMAAEAAQETTQASTAALTEPTVPVQTQSTVPPITAATTPPTEPREILPRFLELYQKNPDLAGWLSGISTPTLTLITALPGFPSSTRPVIQKAATASSMPTTCWTAACSARC